MANRRLFQFRYSFERDIVDVVAKVSFGSTGAPTLVYGKGVTSVTRVSAGKYTIKLQDAYNKLLVADEVPLVSTGAPAAPMMYVVQDNSATLASPTVVVQFADSSGVATDPASGEAVLLRLSLKNSST